MKNIESFILETLESHPCTEFALTEKISTLYPISIFFFHDGSFTSTEIRIILSELFCNGKILISDDDQIFIKDNQRF